MISIPAAPVWPNGTWTPPSTIRERCALRHELKREIELLPIEHMRSDTAYKLRLKLLRAQYESDSRLILAKRLQKHCQFWSIAGISTLPDELLCDIILIATEQSDFISKMTREFAHVAPLVCRRWRDVCATMPQLWSTLVISDTLRHPTCDSVGTQRWSNIVKELPRLLFRCQGAPVTFRFTTRDLDAQATIPTVFATLQTSLASIRSVDIQLSAPYVRDVSKCIATSLPALESLSIQNAGYF
ncbi:hypothetical protein DACRYDRAFT_109909 [Dacryopinax primogenitus]|uniref:Uncharacterized protein n=1 Tax=Dacryopinax primogenitus (strain DJM 731) TaxID=1858805 RepID=M5FT58_DACPD|nr:uncharacterized protein DACRYDRAFT_109909 [Dacryopinax primogenitus]EJT99183.1 hypothetical protein DACRYDRAFT_109909 [Dacryopinax primogenitus]